MKPLLLAALALLAPTGQDAAQGLAPELPNVLILGDSISIGYTRAVQEQLADEARVVRPMRNEKAAENCAQTANGLERIDAWLGDTEWDVIHFNWGLHDLKYVPPTFPKPPLVKERGAAILENPDARQLASLDEYERNLDALIARMKETGARLVFASTTPIPVDSRGRFPGDELRYNEVATKVAAEHGIAVNDLFTFASEHAEPPLSEIQNTADVHFKKEGSALLGARVADVIRMELDRETDTLDMASALDTTAARAPEAGGEATDAAPWRDAARGRHYLVRAEPTRVALYTSLDGQYWTPAEHSTVLGLRFPVAGGEELELDGFAFAAVSADADGGAARALDVVGVRDGAELPLLRIPIR